MNQETAVSGAGSTLGLAIAAMAEERGSAGHRYVSSAELNSEREAARNLADAAHYLCVLHGRQPGVIELAAEHTRHGESRAWLESCIDAFSRERLFLANLTVAAGPQPSTPRHAESDAAVLGQRNAIETLASSEREGCAFGAAAALILDWRAIRTVLNEAADKLAVESALSALPDAAETVAIVEGIADSAAIARAVTFGAEQILAQHRGLWDLLEARQVAREQW